MEKFLFVEIYRRDLFLYALSVGIVLTFCAIWNVAALMFALLRFNSIHTYISIHRIPNGKVAVIFTNLRFFVCSE